VTATPGPPAPCDGANFPDGIPLSWWIRLDCQSLERFEQLGIARSPGGAGRRNSVLVVWTPPSGSTDEEHRLLRPLRVVPTSRNQQERPEESGPARRLKLPACPACGPPLSPVKASRRCASALALATGEAASEPGMLTSLATTGDHDRRFPAGRPCAGCHVYSPRDDSARPLPGTCGTGLADGQPFQTMF